MTNVLHVTIKALTERAEKAEREREIAVEHVEILADGLRELMTTFKRIVQEFEAKGYRPHEEKSDEG